jgi:hypothetical protein
MELLFLLYIHGLQQLRSKIDEEEIVELLRSFCTLSREVYILARLFTIYKAYSKIIVLRLTGTHLVGKQFGQKTVADFSRGRVPKKAKN